MSALNAYDALKDSILSGAQKHDYLDGNAELAIGAIIHDINRSPAEKREAIAAVIAERDQGHYDLEHPEEITAERRIEEAAQHYLEQAGIRRMLEQPNRV